MPIVNLKLFGREGTTYLTLELDDSPMAAAVIDALETTSRETLQARLSGACFCTRLGDDFTAPEGMEGDEKRAELKKGEVAYNTKFHELVVVYGDWALFYDHEVRYPSECWILGKVMESNLDELVEVGNSIWRRGERKARII